MLKPHNRAEVQFNLVREIGQAGKNSTAYIVHDVQLDTEIVMKRLRKADIASPNEYFEEARSLQTTSHQNVVPILYACEDQDYIYLALPYFRHGSLKALMSTKNLTVREIVRIGCQLLSGIHNVHSKNLIHFDIKPDNVLLSDRGEALLSDFGLAKQMKLGQAAQTYLYNPIVAPEVLTGQQFDLGFDIYQFGLTLYSMCCGSGTLRSQFLALGTQANFAAALQGGTYPDRSTFPEHIPDRLRKAIVRCLEVDPNDRFQSALEVANALADVEHCLDWRFEEGVGGKTWTRLDDETERKFSVLPDGSTEFASTKGGNSRRKREHCCNSMTEARIKRVLKTEG
jgi:serine/threonine protein kinase